MKFRTVAGCTAALILTAALGVQPALAANDVYKLSVPSGYENAFVDVQAEDWFYPYVAVLNSRGMIDGYGDGRFGPNDPLTSGAALVMVMKAAGSGTIAPTDAHWASGYADEAVARGYLTQEEIGDLDQPMRRVLVAELAARALGVEPSQEASPFADVENGELTALYELGVISGSQAEEETVFLPDQSITRAEISAIVWQVDRVHTYGKQILFQGGYYEIQEGIPVNSYLPEGFSRDEAGWITYEEEGVTVTRGVDVSVHQGTIDWQQVADAGIDFAMIRVGYRGYGMEGNMRGDVNFLENIQGALDAGLDVGVYYFSQAVTVDEARQEAAYVVEQLASYQDDISYPVVFDWERQNYSGSRTQTIPETDLLCAMANAFCADVEAAGYDAMIYFYQNLAYNNLDLSQLLDYPFWLAQYTDYPTFYYDFHMWQYTSSGQVPGISGSVDLNLRFFRDGELPPAEEEQEEPLPGEDDPAETDETEESDAPEHGEEEADAPEEGDGPQEDSQSREDEDAEQEEN